ncbi:MAG TPA: hypothetical protein VIY48_03300, partial [Candidatus Paceibacterota bacterium]
VKTTSGPSGAGLIDVPKGQVEVSINTGRNQARSTLLHELQHYIQAKEGFDPGGASSSPEAVKYATDLLDLNQKSLDDLPATVQATFRDAAHQGYRRLGGEVEARQTQARRDMTPSQRMATTANPMVQSNIDVPINEIIPQQQYSGSGFSRPAPVDAAAQFKAQLLPYQHPVFDRLYAATLDPRAAFEQTRRLTSLLSDQATLSTTPLPGSASQ